MLQKLPVIEFEWIGDTSQFKEDFIKKYNGDSDEGHFLEVDILVLKKVHRVIKLNQNVWLKQYIDMNIDLRK